MFEIDQFLLEFENLIFEEHLTKLRSFKRRHGNAVSCTCLHINKEKGDILKIMEKYILLSKRFSIRLPLSHDRSDAGSYDVVG